MLYQSLFSNAHMQETTIFYSVTQGVSNRNFIHFLLFITLLDTYTDGIFIKGFQNIKLASISQFSDGKSEVLRRQSQAL